MVSIEGIMHSFVAKELRRLFPSIDGWQIRSIPNTAGAGYIVSQTQPGHHENAHVLVRFTRHVTAEDANALKEMVAAAPLRRMTKSRLVLMIPDGAEVNGIPPEIEVATLRSYGFYGNDLVWIRRREMMREKELEFSANVKA
ncbi:MAG: hypothetical protein A4E42_01118 [Methanoregulaceae archaeon PtaU1.Bin222]|nr:MAG: hypothetical protein A4E42_01118 [Methanoregulaceae archaeon PtaU1.Bin222]